MLVMQYITGKKNEITYFILLIWFNWLLIDYYYLDPAALRTHIGKKHSFNIFPNLLFQHVSNGDIKRPRFTVDRLSNHRYISIWFAFVFDLHLICICICIVDYLIWMCCIDLIDSSVVACRVEGVVAQMLVAWPYSGTSSSSHINIDSVFLYNVGLARNVCRRVGTAQTAARTLELRAK